MRVRVSPAPPYLGYEVVSKGDYTYAKIGEEVDHIDSDPLNDSLDNLQVLSSLCNKSKSADEQYGKLFDVPCPFCSAPIPRRNTRDLKFCSNSCRSKYYGANQWGNKLVGYSKG